MKILTRGTGIFSPELLQRRMSQKELRSRDSLLESLILLGIPPSRSRGHSIGGGDRKPWPLEHIYFFKLHSRIHTRRAQLTLTRCLTFLASCVALFCTMIGARIRPSGSIQSGSCTQAWYKAWQKARSESLSREGSVRQSLAHTRI